MADFENFEGATPENNAEEDPAAAFLAREQDQLAGLDDEGADQGGFEDQNTGFGNEDGEVNQDLGGLGGEQPPADDYSFLEDAGYDGLTTTSDYSNIPQDENAAPVMDDIGSDNEATTNGPSDVYSAISQVDTQRAEPEKIKIWREEQKTRLEEKDADAETKKLEWREIARKELDDWHKNRSDQLEKAKETNRAAEQAFVQERDESIPGHEWERICRLCDFNPKNSKNSKDVSRMRSIILQLKQTPLVR
ncbi:clathrin light chain B-like isoform X2 [Lineus longissimus]|uniref:clathrin light chain B-like isoform X2 n=1 Tax=Lineus longissimus TaxID=88925 RepID=UPI002B4E14AF